MRLDGVLRPHLPGYSRAALHELFRLGLVRADGRVASKGELARAGQVIEVARIGADVESTHAVHAVHAEKSAGPSASDMPPPLVVLYEDEEQVVVNKPAHLPTHALRPFETRTLTRLLLARYPEMAEVGHGPLEPGIVHRLDTETSGVVLAARTAASFDKWKRAHAAGRIDKRYLALCAGQVHARGPVHAYLAADRRKVRVRAEPFSSAKAVSLTVLGAEPFGDFSLVTVAVSFAARHQVRAQLASLGHPIAGDALYGGPALPGLTRHFLHASELIAARRLFAHDPETQEAYGMPAHESVAGQDVRIVAELPTELVAVLEMLRA